MQILQAKDCNITPRLVVFLYAFTHAKLEKGRIFLEKKKKKTLLSKTEIQLNEEIYCTPNYSSKCNNMKCPGGCTDFHLWKFNERKFQWMLVQGRNYAYLLAEGIKEEPR